MTSKILLVDNNDSFTFNLVDLLRKCNNIETFVLQSNTIEISEVSQFDKIIFSPGPDLPSEYPVMSRILESFEDKKHILGICLGHQAICSYYGGKLVNLPEVVHGQSRQIKLIDKEPLFKNIPDEFHAGLYHSWVVETKSLPADLIVTALSSDGFIMGVKHRSFGVFGIQFHPESYISSYGYEIISNFLNY